MNPVFELKSLIGNFSVVMVQAWADTSQCRASIFVMQCHSLFNASVFDITFVVSCTTRVFKFLALCVVMLPKSC